MYSASKHRSNYPNVPLQMRGERDPDEEWRMMFNLGIVFSADGGLLNSGDAVYILALDDFTERVRRIDYFHGVIKYPVALMLDDDNVFAPQMIALNKEGFVVSRITAIQRRWRAHCRLQVDGTLEFRGSGDIGVHCLRGNGEPSRLRGAG